MHWQRRIRLTREVGDREGSANSLVLLGQMAFHQGDDATARSLIVESLALSREIGEPGRIANSLSSLARVTAFQGDYMAARALYEESLATARKIGVKVIIASALEGLAGIVAVLGEPAGAARLWGTAEALREAIGTPLPPIERADYERAITGARTQLGEKAFAVAWAEGRTLTLEQALAAQGPVTLPQQLAAGPAPAPQRSHPGILRD